MLGVSKFVSEGCFFSGVGVEVWWGGILCMYIHTIYIIYINQRTPLLQQQLDPLREVLERRQHQRRLARVQHVRREALVDGGGHEERGQLEEGA